MLHSLVRVSRRVGCSHLSTNNRSARRDRPPARASLPSADTARSPHRGAQTHRGDPARGPCAARVKTHVSPQSLPDRRTDGYTFSARVQRYLPTDLLGQEQLLLAAPHRSARKSRTYPSADAQATPHPAHSPTSPEPETEPLQLHSFPS